VGSEIQSRGHVSPSRRVYQSPQGQRQPKHEQNRRALQQNVWTDGQVSAFLTATLVGRQHAHRSRQYLHRTDGR
jgi:hypothetical protein